MPRTGDDYEVALRPCEQVVQLGRTVEIVVLPVQQQGRKANGPDLRLVGRRQSLALLAAGKPEAVQHASDTPAAALDDHAVEAVAVAGRDLERGWLPRLRPMTKRCSEKPPSPRSGVEALDDRTAVGDQVSHRGAPAALAVASVPRHEQVQPRLVVEMDEIVVVADDLAVAWKKRIVGWDGPRT